MCKANGVKARRHRSNWNLLQRNLRSRENDYKEFQSIRNKSRRKSRISEEELQPNTSPFESDTRQIQTEGNELNRNRIDWNLSIAATWVRGIQRNNLKWSGNVFKWSGINPPADPKEKSHQILSKPNRDEEKIKRKENLIKLVSNQLEADKNLEEQGSRILNGMWRILPLPVFSETSTILKKLRGKLRGMHFNLNTIQVQMK